jgi:hypothetical protein
MTDTPTIAGDRLYGISIHPQELALYGDKVEFHLRYSPIFDDENEVAERHFKLMVLEIFAEIPADNAMRSRGSRLQLLKCGWELELEVGVPVQVGTLTELDNEVPLLLGRIADTVNELARRARLEAPLGPDVVKGLIADYRAQAASSAS